MSTSDATAPGTPEWPRGPMADWISAVRLLPLRVDVMPELFEPDTTSSAVPRMPSVPASSVNWKSPIGTIVRSS